VTPDDPRHGTPNGYSNHACRCDRCRHAWTESQRPYSLAYRRRRGDRPLAEHNAEQQANAHPCGTHAAYNRHRKRGETPCRTCRDGEAAYKRGRRLARR
jgi:hypothetical protein